jgi:tagatose-1,6-bisphosphate aldolase
MDESRQKPKRGHCNFPSQLSRKTVMEIHTLLMQDVQNGHVIKNNLPMYISAQYYYDNIEKIINDKIENGEIVVNSAFKYRNPDRSYTSEVIRKIIRAETIKKSGQNTLKILSMYRSLSGKLTIEEIISKIQEQVECPKERIIEVIEGI